MIDEIPHSESLKQHMDALHQLMAAQAQGEANARITQTEDTAVSIGVVLPPPAQTDKRDEINETEKMTPHHPFSTVAVTIVIADPPNTTNATHAPSRILRSRKFFIPAVIFYSLLVLLGALKEGLSDVSSVEPVDHNKHALDYLAFTITLTSEAALIIDPILENWDKIVYMILYRKFPADFVPLSSFKNALSLVILALTAPFGVVAESALTWVFMNSLPKEYRLDFLSQTVLIGLNLSLVAIAAIDKVLTDCFEGYVLLREILAQQSLVHYRLVSKLIGGGFGGLQALQDSFNYFMALLTVSTAIQNPVLVSFILGWCLGDGFFNFGFQGIICIAGVDRMIDYLQRKQFKAQDFVAAFLSFAIASGGAAIQFATNRYFIVSAEQRFQVKLNRQSEQAIVTTLTSLILASAVLLRSISMYPWIHYMVSWCEKFLRSSCQLITDCLPHQDRTKKRKRAAP